MVYLVYPQDLRELTERVLSASQSIEMFLENLKQAISAEVDSTHKTDGQIFFERAAEKFNRLDCLFPIDLSPLQLLKEKGKS
jgi:hypothetical protein